MNQKVQIDQAVLRILYFKYKEYIVPGIIFIVSWFVFMQFALPQIQSFLSEKDQAAASEQTLAVMTQNYNIMAAQKETELDNFLEVANAALPKSKDFAGILTAISNAAGLSGVTLSDYTFEIGDLTDTKISTDQPVKINLNINGTFDQTKKFLAALQLQLPISEVTSVNILSASSASINANFYYSPLSKITFDETTPLAVLSSSEKKMLVGLSNTNLPSRRVEPIVTPTPASDSATLTPAISPTSASSVSASKR